MPTYSHLHKCELGPESYDHDLRYRCERYRSADLAQRYHCAAISWQSVGPHNLKLSRSAATSHHYSCHRAEKERQAGQGRDRDCIKVVQAELEAYLSKPASDKSVDQLKWWSMSAATYPVLSAVALSFLSTVVIIVPWQRLFNMASIIVNDLCMV